MYVWGKGWVAGRVRLSVGNRGSGQVGSMFRRVGSGPRKVTRGQLWDIKAFSYSIYYNFLTLIALIILQ